MSKEHLSDRRKFILTIARGIGLSAIGALTWSAYIEETKAAPLLLRPPGAREESEFLKACIKCGLCVEACPYDTLKLAALGDNAPIGTPYFTPRDIPCYMCEDIPCVPVCPTTALDVTSVSKVEDGKSVLDINSAKMGTAVIDANSCIAFWGIQCDACYRACPLLDVAITVEYERNDRTGKHAFLKPVVHVDACTGCGMCERACVTEKAAIYVLPVEVAQGRAGAHYVRGWDREDQKRVAEAKGETTTTKLSEKSVLDSLNDTEGLY